MSNGKTMLLIEMNGKACTIYINNLIPIHSHAVSGGSRGRVIPTKGLLWAVRHVLEFSEHVEAVRGGLAVCSFRCCLVGGHGFLSGCGFLGLGFLGGCGFLGRCGLLGGCGGLCSSFPSTPSMFSIPIQLSPITMHIVDQLDRPITQLGQHIDTVEKQAVKEVVDSIDTNREEAAGCHGVKHVSNQFGGVLV